MSVWTKVKGTIETFWQIGLGGPQLKANAGVIEARDSADAAFVKMRALDPAAASDVATKNYVDTGALGGAVRCVKYNIANTPASQDSTTVIPANAVIHRREVEVTTPFSGGATIAIGQAGSTSLLMGTTDINPQAAGVYVVDQNTAWGAAPLAVRATLVGAPAAGAATVTVLWSLPTN
jgi:hypothetical protein